MARLKTRRYPRARSEGEVWSQDVGGYIVTYFR